MVGVVIAALAGILLWLVMAPTGRRRVADSHLDDETVAAEHETRDLNALTTPEDADDELPDWGPGAPKQRR